MVEKLKAYVDLTRLHFFFVWPTLFCSGLFLAFQYYGGFSWLTILKASLIGFFGFEAGLVLNDIVDRDIDEKKAEDTKLTNYWRIFRSRPLSTGVISVKQAKILFSLLVALTIGVILTLPFPNSFYVITIMFTCYGLEYFYQIKKRKQKVPIAQVLGRVDFALFPIAGYLCLGKFDINILLIFIFFYPLALAHLGVNDLIDEKNDRIKQMKTIPVLYGNKKTTYWILIFSLIHFVNSIVFLTTLQTTAVIGFILGFFLIFIGNYIIMKDKNFNLAIKALPMFHLAMLTYAISIISQYLIRITS